MRLVGQRAPGLPAHGTYPSRLPVYMWYRPLTAKALHHETPHRHNLALLAVVGVRDRPVYPPHPQAIASPSLHPRAYAWGWPPRCVFPSTPIRLVGLPSCSLMVPPHAPHRSCSPTPSLRWTAWASAWAPPAARCTPWAWCPLCGGCWTSRPPPSSGPWRAACCRWRTTPRCCTTTSTRQAWRAQQVGGPGWEYGKPGRCWERRVRWRCNAGSCGAGPVLPCTGFCLHAVHCRTVTVLFCCCPSSCPCRPGYLHPIIRTSVLSVAGYAAANLLITRAGEPQVCDTQRVARPMPVAPQQSATQPWHALIVRRAGCCGTGARTTVRSQQHATALCVVLLTNPPHRRAAL